jgi:hypothetical protein
MGSDQRASFQYLCLKLALVYGLLTGESSEPYMRSVGVEINFYLESGRVSYGVESLGSWKALENLPMGDIVDCFASSMQCATTKRRAASQADEF